MHFITGTIDKLVGANVCALRRERGLSAADCACALRMEVALFREHEAGLHRFSAGHLMTLAERLGVPLSAFYVGSDTGAPEPKSVASGTSPATRREKA